MKNLLEKISTLNCLVIGDVMLDHYMIGDATRISPEAPVPVVNIESDKYVLGGAANVACNLATLGANVELCGVIGNDVAGEKIINLLADNKISFDKNFINNNTDTITKTRILVRGQQLCRLDREQMASNYLLDVKKYLKLLCNKICKSNVLILSDYAKGVFDNNNVTEFINYAHSIGKFVALDPKPKHKLLFKGVDLMTPNLNEACELAGVDHSVDGRYDLKFICQKIYKNFMPRILVITMGANGMLLSKNGEIVSQIPTYSRDVFDVSGAGDTSVACLSAALATGCEITEAAHFANIAAGIVVGKIGTATVSPDEILNFSMSC